MNDDNDDSQNVQTGVITNLGHKELMSELRKKLMETICYKETKKRMNVMELNHFLKRHVMFVTEPSPEIVDDIKIEKMDLFCEESEKHLKLGADYFCSTKISTKINDLFDNCNQMFFETRTISKCSLFPEFTTLHEFYKEFKHIQKKYYYLRS